MPYLVRREPWRREGKQWVVRKRHGLKLVGRHATKEDAQAQVKAIEANSHE